VTRHGEIHELAAELGRAMPDLDPEEQTVAVSLYRLLAAGRPVAATSLAERASVPVARVRPLLERWPAVYLDENREVVGFWGLALGEMPHQLEVDGKRLYTWCAWDALFVPLILDRPVRVESTCPTTAERITLRVDAQGPAEISPKGAVLSFLRPDAPFGHDVVLRFCHFVHFFASGHVAREWTAEHANTFVLSIEDGFKLGRLTNRLNFGAVLESGQTR
jgi:alkylmercury lyase